MFSPSTLQAKLLVSVFFIVCVTFSSMTALVIFLEKRSYQKSELERIYYQTEGMKERLGQLISGKNWRYLMMSLSHVRKTDPSILFTVVTGTNGEILVADGKPLAGRDQFDLTRIPDPDTPLYSENDTGQDGKILPGIQIFHSMLSTGGGMGEDEKNIFEVVYDINYAGKNMGRLRVGFSRKEMDRHFQFLTAGMAITGLSVCLAVLAMIYFVIRSHMIPMEAFVRDVSCLDLNRDGKSLKNSLAELSMDRNPGESRDVSQLKQAFRHIRDQFVHAWDQLENHRTNLAHMVNARTVELDRSNQELSRQIQERKEIETRILTAQKLETIGTLAGGVAHEFNNLFMAIGGYATLIQTQSGSGHPNTEKAEKIRALVDKGAGYVQQLMGFARSGKYAPGPLNLNDILMSNQVIFASSSKNITVVTDEAPGLWAVHADRSQMDQVVMNLMLNAMEAMSGTGRIHLKTSNQTLDRFQVSLEKQVSGRFVMFCVSDDGSGIAPDILPRIFDPFFTTKAVGQGTGMGLASVFGIVENHGGFITVESETGSGTLFCVYMPALKKL